MELYPNKSSRKIECKEGKVNLSFLFPFSQFYKVQTHKDKIQTLLPWVTQGRIYLYCSFLQNIPPSFSSAFKNENVVNFCDLDVY